MRYPTLNVFSDEKGLPRFVIDHCPAAHEDSVFLLTCWVPVESEINKKARDFPGFLLVDLLFDQAAFGNCAGLFSRSSSIAFFN